VGPVDDLTPEAVYAMRDGDCYHTMLFTEVQFTLRNGDKYAPKDETYAELIRRRLRPLRARIYARHKEDRLSMMETCDNAVGYLLGRSADETDSPAHERAKVMIMLKALRHILREEENSVTSTAPPNTGEPR
jgi:hypothetical protein